MFLADTSNNRILIWNTAPTGNVPADIVIGQKDFTANDAGTDRDSLDWPVSLATDGRRIVAADACGAGDVFEIELRARAEAAADDLRRVVGLGRVGFGFRIEVGEDQAVSLSPGLGFTSGGHPVRRDEGTAITLPADESTLVVALRAVSRDDLRKGAEEIGLPLEEHITNVIAFMRERGFGGRDRNRRGCGRSRRHLQRRRGLRGRRPGGGGGGLRGESVAAEGAGGGVRKASVTTWGRPCRPAGCPPPA